MESERSEPPLTGIRRRLERAHTAWESLGELVWAGVPRGDAATCSTCGGLWPFHDPEDCFIGEAMGVLAEQREDVELLLAVAEAAAGLVWEIEHQGRPNAARAELKAALSRLIAEREM